MKNKINSYPLRFYNQNNRPYNYFSNNSDFSHNSNQKIITVERNLNDLKLETETELSKKDGNLSFILDGLQKELDEMDQNIIETDKKLKGATQKNIENSKRLRHKSYNFLKSPAQGKYIQSQINFFSPEKYLNYETPSSIYNKNTNYKSNNDLSKSYFNNYNKRKNNIYDNDFLYNKNYSTYDYNINDDHINTYYKRDII